MDKADRKIMDIQKVLLGSFCLVFPSLEIISHLYPQVLYCPLYKFKLKMSKLVCYCCYRTGNMFLGMLLACSLFKNPPA